MTPEQFRQFMTQIVSNASDQGKLTQILSDMETEVTTNHTRFTDLEKQTAEQATHIDSLQKTNMNLFLKVGNPVPDSAVRAEKTLSYEDLFDEKGGLK